MRYLLDTNVISELVAKSPNKRMIDWLRQLDSNNVYLSAITFGEIRKGIEKLPNARRKEKLRSWLMDEVLVLFQDRILVLDTSVMLAWGELVGRLELTGRSLPAFDALIAASALVHGCTLVSRNEMDFRGTGITVLNPWTEVE